MSKVDDILSEYGMTRENWETDPAMVAALISALDAVPEARPTIPAYSERFYQWLDKHYTTWGQHGWSVGSRSDNWSLADVQNAFQAGSALQDDPASMNNGAVK